MPTNHPTFILTPIGPSAALALARTSRSPIRALQLAAGLDPEAELAAAVAEARLRILAQAPDGDSVALFLTRPFAETGDPACALWTLVPLPALAAHARAFAIRTPEAIAALWRFEPPSVTRAASYVPDAFAASAAWHRRVIRSEPAARFADALGPNTLYIIKRRNPPCSGQPSPKR